MFAIPPILEAASPLHKAVATGKIEEVRQLIKRGSNLNEKTRSGYTPLHLAAGRGYAKIVKLLILKGADVNLKDKHGRTPLDLAVLKKNNEVIRELDQSTGNIDNKKDINWFVTFFGARFSEGDLADILDSKLDSSANLLGLAVTRKMFDFFTHFDFELQGQVVKHIGGSHHWELNGLFLVRYLTFPWNHYVNTSVAVGEGYSYATSEHKKESNAVKGLNYLLFELALSLPEYEEWSLVGIVHHRSNIFGAIGPKDTIGSNYVGLGLKYGFEGF
ncbi:MAG: ankyrin repeat domain-containing protein [Desulfobacterales bacterium]